MVSGYGISADSKDLLALGAVVVIGYLVFKESGGIIGATTGINLNDLFHPQNNSQKKSQPESSSFWNFVNLVNNSNPFTSWAL